MSNKSVHFSNDKQTWETPQDFFDKVNNIFKEAQIEQKVYSSNDLSRNILIEMIKVKDKEKYQRKIEIDTTTNLEKLSDEDIAKQIQIIQDKINKGLK